MTPRSRGLLLLGCALVGFVVVVAAMARPANPQRRLPQQYRLAELISDQQREVRERRRTVAALREEVSALRASQAGRVDGAQARGKALEQAETVTGLAAVQGPGVEVTLQDSALTESPTGNVNDLVIHSEDVQAVVNALWRAGAEAVSINGQRLVPTSAVLCVGNTLLLNGTVHSPPYVVSAVGASREAYESDRLVVRLIQNAHQFSLGYEIKTLDRVRVPAFSGSTTPRFATAS